MDPTNTYFCFITLPQSGLGKITEQVLVALQKSLSHLSLLVTIMITSHVLQINRSSSLKIFNLLASRITDSNRLDNEIDVYAKQVSHLLSVCGGFSFCIFKL